jgi:hypothetical protein
MTEVAPTTVAMPVIPPRGFGGDSHKYAYRVEGIEYVEGGGLMEQAVASVHAQTVAPIGGIQLAADLDRQGAAATRQRALEVVETEYVSFLDDDDLFYPHHIETHWRLLRETGADVAYSWFDGNRPFPERSHRGRQFDPANPHHITMTLTVRTELARQVGFRRDPNASAECAGEDWMFITGLADAGARFVGTGDITWHYRLHDHNTSGLGHRW